MPMTRPDLVELVAAYEAAHGGIVFLADIEGSDAASLAAGEVHAALTEAGFTIEPVRDVELWRVDMLSSVIRIGYMTAVVAPLGTAISLYNGLRVSSPRAAVAVAASAWGVGLFLFGGLTRMMQRFAAPTARQRAHDMKSLAKAAAAKEALEAERAEAERQKHERLVNEMKATEAEFRPRSDPGSGLA